MIGVIADDLTGAAEIGALGWRHGLRAEIITAGVPAPEADLVCIDTDSRAVSADEARRRAGAAAELLVRAGADWIYKKVDSALRGHVVAEIKAILNELEWKAALLVPANPSRGRIIRNGEYFINGTPIHQTEFGRDPDYPHASADLLELLAGPAGGSVRVGNLRTSPELSGIVVGEAESGADLERWVERRSPGVLMCGAAEFFGALLGVEPSGNATKSEAGSVSGTVTGEIFVCGSVSDATRRFVDWARSQGTPVLNFPETAPVRDEPEARTVEACVRRVVEALREHARVVLTTPATIVADSRSSRGMAEHLAHLASAVLRSVQVAHVYAEGGATAAHVVNRMGWNRLRIVREIAPGVVSVEVGAGQLPLLTLKPGSYGWPAEVQRNRESGPVVACGQDSGVRLAAGRV